MKGARRLILALLTMVALAATALAPPATALASTSGATTLADPITTGTWKDWGLESSTQNVGRIWTDKSVSTTDIELTGAGGTTRIPKGDSDFLTAFSALSSTSNQRETATTPLDIVLVLDASGSMDYSMGGGDSTTRIKALKDAAGSFIDELAARNATISDVSQRHAVSIVKFSGNKTDAVGNSTYRNDNNTYNYSQVMAELTTVDATGAKTLKEKVNAISPAGATRADNGVALAKEQLTNHGRAEARKVVVFFTDGEPTSFRDFDANVANAAVSTAKTMKDSGVTIYTIGIQSGANPSDTRDSTNAFLNALSSNYPSATAYNKLGKRAENASYYKSATNAAELKSVFDGISQEIGSAAGYPTEVREGMEDASGYVTFTDQLGDYMQVDDFNCIVFANKVFSAHTKTTSGSVDTYAFSGTAGNSLYPAGDLEDVIIEVRHGSDLKTGDHVTVKVPAALVPLRSFDIDVDAALGSVSLTFPIRVFFGSSVKPEAVAALANPDADLADYVKANTDANGNVAFLANAWDGGSDGSACASFTPARTNSYYYITQDTPIYTDRARTIRASYPLVAGQTYYYGRDYYDIESGTQVVAKTVPVSFDSGAVENINGYVSGDADGLAYFEAGTPRMTYIDELRSDKGPNATQTATSYINPKWAGSQVFVWLGNNGRVSVPLPGALEVQKQIEVPDGYDEADFADEEFSFTISVPEAAGKTLTGTVTKDGRVQGDANFSLTLDAAGAYAHTLKPGEKLTITGLAAGWDFEVTEAARDGWTASATGEKGTIAAGATSAVTFTNRYAAHGTLAATGLAGEKVVTGRDWRASDRFAFVLTGVDGAPMPEGSQNGKKVCLLVDGGSHSEGAPKDFDFGGITYDRPGTYVYNVVEARAGDGYDVHIGVGMSVSQALYRVTVTVTDPNHDGNLQVSSTMLRLKDDAGIVLDEPQETGAARFTNEYATLEAKWDLRGTKNYEDKTGTRPLSSGMFEFELTAVDEDAPMPANAENGRVRAKVDATGRFAFAQTTFDNDDVGKTYRYTLREVNGGVAGVTYDDTAWNVTVGVRLDDDTVALDISNVRVGAEEGTASEPVSFSNSYEAEPAVAEHFIRGTKTLLGRDSLDGEKFAFSLTQVRGPEDGVTGFSTEAEVTDLAAGEAKAFDFGTATFTRAGTYVFEVREDAPAEAAGGMTYDGHVCTVTVRVADAGGKLVVSSVTYSDEDGTGDAQGATFFNSYEPAAAAYPGIVVSKVLNGRTMRAGEFGFAISGADEQSEALLASSDRTFSNASQKASGEKDVMTKLDGITFTKADVGKTYRFDVREVVPAEGERLPGVTYDEATHRVEVSVDDALDGTLQVSTTVDGVEGSEVAFANGYEAAPGSFATADLGLGKVLSGRAWDEGDSFTFEVTAAEGVPLPERTQVTVGAADVRDGRATIDFGSITYDAAGRYDYEVREVGAGQTVAGVTYSSNVARIQVSVVDDVAQGKLVATARLTGGSATFENAYRAELDYNAQGGLSVTKTLTGTSTAARRFGFVIEALDDDVLGIAGSYESATIADGGTVTVAATSGRVVFTQADAGKSWTYRVTENDPGAGYACDCASWTVTVSVANDVVAGRLVATTTVDGGAGGSRTWTYASDGEPGDAAVVAFVNRYAASGATGDVVGTKTLSGRPMSDGEFRFELAYAAAPQTVVSTATNAGGLVDFGSLSFTTSELDELVAEGLATRVESGWTVGYVAREVTDGLAAGGITAEASSFAVTVNVTDNGDGTLACDVAYPAGGLAFENAYGAADASIEVAGTKTLTGRELREGEFGFTITGEPGAPLPERTSVTNDADGGYSFGKIYFSLEGVFGEKDEEVVREEKAADEAAAEGETAAEAQAEGDDGEVVAVEELEAETEAESEPVVTSRQKTFRYTVTETGSVAGVTNDARATREVLVRVTDDGLGTLTAEFVDAAGNSTTPDLAFVNSYSVVPTTSSVTDQVSVTKTLTGRDLVAGEFGFEMLEDGVVVATGTNDAAGVVALSPITYTAAGGHAYVIREIGAGSVANGVTFDGAAFHVNTTVTDAGDGTLAVEHVLVEDEAVFANTYEAEPAEVALLAKKTLTGAELADGQFEFELSGEGQTWTARNSADGAVAFPLLSFEAPGTYVYQVREVDDGQADVTYDKSVYTVTVTVTDDGLGHLSAEVTSDAPEDALTFVNAYEPPAPPEDPKDPTPPEEPEVPETTTRVTTRRVTRVVPKTGDVTSDAAMVAVLVAAASLLLAAARRR